MVTRGSGARVTAVCVLIGTAALLTPAGCVGEDPTLQSAASNDAGGTSSTSSSTSSGGDGGGNVGPSCTTATIVCLHDADGDGYTSADATQKTNACLDPTKNVAPTYGCADHYIQDTHQKGSDCNDLDPLSHPDANALCDGVDHTCENHPWKGCPSSAPKLGPVVSSAIAGITVTVNGCGTQTYQSTSTACPAGAAVGLSGFSGGTYSAPTQLSFICNAGVIGQTFNTPEYNYKLAWNGANTTSPLTGPGRTDDTAGSATCNEGDWVVGVKHTSSCLFDRITIICAPITYVRSGASWVATPGTAYTKNALGNFGSTQMEETFQCDAGSVMTELTEWHTTGTAGDSNYVSAFKLGCKPAGYTAQ